MTDERFEVDIDGASWHVSSESAEYDAIHAVAGAVLAGAENVGVTALNGDIETEPDGIQCVLCDETSATIEDHTQHMSEVHGDAVMDTGEDGPPEITDEERAEIPSFPAGEMGAPEYDVDEDDEADVDGESEVDESTAAPEVFACEDCGKTFDTERGKNIHRSKAHADDDEEHECPSCGDVFDTPVGMKTHHHRVHDITVDELPDDHDESKATIEAVDEDDVQEDAGQDGTDDDGDTNDQQGQPDLPFGCPVVGCEKRFADRDDRDVHRDDIHDETEVLRGYRERARDDLHDGLSVTDVEAAAAANTRVNDVADALDTRPRHARKWLNMLQLNPALEEFGEVQARHMIEDLHERLGVDEPLPPMDAEGEGGEAA